MLASSEELHLYKTEDRKIQLVARQGRNVRPVAVLATRTRTVLPSSARTASSSSFRCRGDDAVGHATHATRHARCFFSRSRISTSNSWSLVNDGGGASFFVRMIQPRNFTMKRNRAKARMIKFNTSPKK